MCHARHHHHRAARPPAEDALRQDPGLRASDTERESTVDLLREHGAAGRLDVDELEQRVGAAYAARTHGDLSALLADLPARTPARVVAGPRRHDNGWGGFLAVNLVLVAIWAVTGAGYFWPAWVMVWWGFALAMRTAPGLLRPR